MQFQDRHRRAVGLHPDCGFFKRFFQAILSVNWVKKKKKKPFRSLCFFNFNCCRSEKAWSDRAKQLSNRHKYHNGAFLSPFLRNTKHCCWGKIKGTLWLILLTPQCKRCPALLAAGRLSPDTAGEMTTPPQSAVKSHPPPWVFSKSFRMRDKYAFP